MPRENGKSRQVVIPTTSLVASATRYSGQVDRIYRPRQEWQIECYRHYAICGEARFAARFFGHAVSRAYLGVAELGKDGKPETTTTGPAKVLLDELFSGKDGQKEMLDAIGVHLTIAGECYLVGRETDEGDVWEIISCLEMKVTGKTWQINYGAGLAAITLAEEDVVIRIWLPNPAQRVEADSPFRSLLPILTEIEWLTRHVYAQVQSRLAGAGILIMPQGMSFPPPPDQEGVRNEDVNEANSFMLTLADAMITPIKDPGSPSALVPIVVTAPDDMIDKPRLLTFWSELESAAMELRNEAIRRFALGMDLPPEQVLGMSSNGGTGGGTSNGVSHWGAWQIEESTIKLHIEPMLDVIVNAITIGYLRPGLPATSAFVVHDLANLRLRPDRSRESIELYDRGAINVACLRRENGFSEDDVMDEKEFQRWLTIKVASGSSTPEQVQAALEMLGVHLDVQSTEPSAPREERPPPSIEDHPNRDLPEAASLLPACDALVYRALERAGNRLRQSGHRPTGVPSYETHTLVASNGNTALLLDGAWSCALSVLDGFDNPPEIVDTLNRYATSLLVQQRPHTRADLAKWLEAAS